MKLNVKYIITFQVDEAQVHSVSLPFKSSINVFHVLFHISSFISPGLYSLKHLLQRLIQCQDFLIKYWPFKDLQRYKSHLQAKYLWWLSVLPID